MARDFTEDDDALLDELGAQVEAEEAATYTPRQERIIAGFEDIQRFVAENARMPMSEPGRDIFERLYAIRLERLRLLPECREVLKAFDVGGLLGEASDIVAPNDAEPVEDDEDILAALGLDDDTADGDGSITDLRYVRSSGEKRAADDVADRKACKDFDAFKPLFDVLRDDLKSGRRQTRPFEGMAEIEPGRFFIVGGQIAYVAERLGEFRTQYDRRDARMRIVYDNGTESDLLLRSLQRALHRDDAGRRVTEPEAGPLFGSTADGEDIASGTIYVLRSLSADPFIAEHRAFVHKIGMTGGEVATRVAGARNDPTYLLADVEIVAEYAVYNIDRRRLEALLHRVFAPAALSVEIADRFGRKVKPHEWFFVPLSIIDEAIEALKDGTIVDKIYDPDVGGFAAAPQTEEIARPKT